MDTLGTGAAQLNFLFQIGSYRTILFDFGTDVSSWTFELVIKRNKGDRVNTIRLVLGSGLSFPVYQSDQIQATFSSTITSIQEGEYYIQLRRLDVPMPLVNGLAYFSFDAPQGTTDSSELEFTLGSQTIELNLTNVASGLATGTYSTTLTFDEDKDIYKDATGLSITFTLGTDNVNGVGIFLRLNKPTAVTFPANFEADPSSSALDATKLNVYFLLFFTNWNGSGTDRVIYKNALYTAI